MDWIKDFLSPELVWFVIGLVLLLLEFLLPGLVVFFFGIGAWVVAAVCLFTDISINVQLLIFIAASVISLLALRRWLKGIFIGHVTSKQDAKVNIEEFVGQKVVVKKKITPELSGTVELHGTDWEASADEEIQPGTVVKVVAKDNITLKVKSLK